MRLGFSLYDSPVGPLFIAADENGALVRIHFLGTRSPSQVVAELAAWADEVAPDEQATAAAVSQLQDYFAQRLTQFTVPLNPRGSAFQQAVWRELTRIPYGTCTSYGEIARTLGTPGGSRAVGLANNQNPIPIMIPCHRVIAANGNLTGFGGGVEVKIELLRLEGYFML